MKPAFSIVFFTVSSGAGLGLLALIALADLFASGTLSTKIEWRGALLAIVLVALGLASSVLHLANPRNAWRSFSRFRTSWLSREAVFAAALFPIAAIYIILAATRTDSWRAFFALATCVVAWAALFSTAMIYASLKPIRQWRTPWTPVNYLLLGHWSGAFLLAATVSAYGAPARPLLVLALCIGVAALAAKLAYWYSISERAAGTKSAPTLERAIGVEQGVHGPGPMSVAHARLLDVGHSHGTFLTDEFGFALARRHATVLRGLALALGFGLPLIWLIAGTASWQLGLAAAACGIIGLLAERWLFFAEARHTVRLYHGDPRT